MYSSRSLWDGVLPRLQDMGVEPDPDGSRKSYVPGQEDQRLRLVERVIDLGEEGRFLVAVAGDAAEIDEEIVGVRSHLVDDLCGAGAGAVAHHAVPGAVRPCAAQPHFGEPRRHPLRGRAEKLEGSFPVEIAPLARETNALIDANREIVERARTHVGNLAHALKTPLSVMVNEAERARRRSARCQGDGADQHHARAGDAPSRARPHRGPRRGGRHHHRGRAGGAGAVRTMEKTHHGKDLAVVLDLPAQPRFRGERQDLEEMVGNLVDNAFKWAARGSRSRSVWSSPEPGRERGPHHGRRRRARASRRPQREQVARRGRRLDETKPGSGLGLSIVVELARLYGGALNLGNSPIGGLRAELVLPAG